MMARPSDRACAPAGLSQQAVSGIAASPSRDEEWRGTKAQREALRAMFDGRCAYCGNDLGRAMHADHVEPCIRIKPSPWNDLKAVEMIKPERNTVGNMMPACAPCNLHKGGYSLEGWRDILQRSAAIVAKQTSTFRAGERFGVITVSSAPVVFYFERIAKCSTCRGEDYPIYGVAPHECYWRKGPDFTIGQSTLLSPDDWVDLFVPDLDECEDWSSFVYPGACGTFYCPECQRAEYAAVWKRLVDRIGPPLASGMSAGTAETAQQAQGVARQPDPQGDAPTSSPTPPEVSV